MSLPESASGHPARLVMEACAGLARDLLVAAYGSATVAGVKGRGNVVTEVDVAVERAVTGLLRAEFPGHAILAEEESPETRLSGWTWIIDPIDGTKNFSRGLPHFCFAMALYHGGKAVAALTMQPLLNEVFYAERGAGAELNGRRIAVSGASTIRESVVAIDLGFEERAGVAQLALANDVFPGVESIRVPGSAALGFAYAACGRWDIYVHRDLSPWDSAGGLLLIREAGGVASRFDGDDAGPFDRGVVCGSPAVVSEFLKRFGEVGG